MPKEEYKAIARRFRPAKFSEVTGQEAIVTTLKNAMMQNKVAHAYLFCGIRGVGKTTLARLFAKALNCEKRTEECEPCNKCSSCIEIANAESLDVLEIDGASNRGIDDIRNLNDSLGYATFNGRYKILIIDEVHMLTKEAFNALLKSLEEPPPNVKFLLATTEPQKVLPTIISRCQRFDLARIDAALIMKKLRHIGKENSVDIDDDALSLIAKLSEGSLRDAESLLDQIICFGHTSITAPILYESLGFVSREEFFQLDAAFANEDLLFGFTLAQKLFSTGKDIHYFIEMLFEHYRNIIFLLLQKITLDAFSEAEQTGYRKALSIYTTTQALYILDYLTKLTLQQSKTNWKRVHLEMAFIHIIQSKHRVSIEEILRQIQELKSSKDEKLEARPKPAESKPLEMKPSEVKPPEMKPLEMKPVEPKPSEIKPLEVKPAEGKPLEVNIPSSPASAAKEEAPLSNQARHETLLRFASAELNGILKK